ncbi:MAG: TIGR04002 family protein [Lachnospira sp.]|nr:TIGR04002 family protein [Lachnospira sp.]
MKNVKYITATGVFATLIMIMTAYICHVPIGVNGGYIHFGDTLIYLAAALLPTPYALVAAAIGGGMADLLTAPVWAPATIIIKMLITVPFTSKKGKMLNVRNSVALVIGCAITVLGYFVAETIMFGQWKVAVLSMPQNLVQAVGSAVFFIILSFALDKAGVKRRFF